MREHDELKALRELQEVWEGLGSWVEADTYPHVVSPDALKAFRTLVGRAQLLVGQTSHLGRLPGWDSFDPSRRAFQGILATHDLRAARTDSLWGVWWEAGNSAIVQAIGRQEERLVRLEAQELSPETVLRWRYLIVFVERLRVATNWPFSRIRFLAPLVTKVEKWPVYRLVSVLANFGGLIGLILLGIAAASLLARCL